MNIEEYEFSDQNIKSTDDFMDAKGFNGPFMAIDVVSTRIHFNTDDVIALAKHFNLTADDIKDK